MVEDTQVVVFASQKGGSGKTTLSGHIAVQAELAGAGPVALIDTDPQGSLAKWWNVRDSETPVFAQVSVPDLPRDIAILRDNGIKLIIIDTPPAVTSSIAEVITHADLVVLPTRPSPHDLRAVGPTVDIVEYQQKSLVFVVNAATVRARITGETAVALSQHGTVAPVTLHHRVDFAASMIDGRTVGEVNPNSKSAKEVASLWEYLSDRLMRLRGTADVIIHHPRKTFENGLLTPAHAESGQEDIETEITSPQVVETPVIRAVPPVAPVEEHEPPAPVAEPLDDHPSDTEWDGVDRRQADLGPPAGVMDRRYVRHVFGRRGTA